MKKFISCLLVSSLLFCFSHVSLAESSQEVVIDTEVPVFENLEHGATYKKSKTVSIADLSVVGYIVMKAGNGTSVFGDKEFTGYTTLAKKELSEGFTCINYTDIYTANKEGTYLVYATDIYEHDIAVKFKITTGTTDGGGGGGGGGGSNPDTGIDISVSAPYANGDPKNTGGTVQAGKKITLDTDTASAKIYYTVDGKNPTEKSSLYDEKTTISLEEGQTLKAVAIKRSISSEVSQWVCEAKKEASSLVGDSLITEEHIVYMQGYPDETFAPDNNMTRAEVSAMFARLMKEKMSTSKIYKSSFSDVASGEWYANYIGYIEKSGIITGYEDGTFKPQNTITRAEFVTMASRFAEIDEDLDCDFEDVTDEHWAYKYIAFASDNKWIDGYEDDTFRPEKTITRAEAVTIVNRMLERSADEEYIEKNMNSLVSFKDVTEAHWAYFNIFEATNEHDFVTANGKETWK